MTPDKPNVTVTREQPLTITDNNRIFGTVTIQPGGKIFIQTVANISIDILIAPAFSDQELRALRPQVDNYALSIVMVGQDGTHGTDGQPGSNGNNGAAGANANCNWSSGCIDGSAGQDGTAGGDGSNGSDGGRGGDAPNPKIYVGELQGTAAIFSKGGKGGNGGNGGNGGFGGFGGNGGNGSSSGTQRRFAYLGGKGGNGGNGGNGGKGGDAGKSGGFQIRYGKLAPKSGFIPLPPPPLHQVGDGGKGGRGGDGGRAGYVGKGDMPGGSFSGENGNYIHAGDGGKPGRDGQPGAYGAPDFTIVQPDIQQGPPPFSE